MALDSSDSPSGTPAQKAIANTAAPNSEGSWCEIRVRGHLGNEWSDWFGELELERSRNGEMILSGHIVDQGALIGILLKLNRLNLVLTSICCSQKVR